MTKERQASKEHEPIWVEALLAAAGVASKASTSEQELIRTVTEELRRLNLRGGVGLLTTDGNLQIQSRSISQSLESTLQRLTGLEITGYTFNPLEVDAYRQALASHQAVYCEDRSELVSQLTPAAARPLLPRIIRLLGVEPVIIAPLLLNDEPIGTINVHAKWLTEADLPIVEALASNITVAIGQVRQRARLKRALELQALRNQVAETLSSNLELPIVMDRTLQLCAQLTGADAGGVVMLDLASNTFSIPYNFGVPDEIPADLPPKGEGLLWETLHEKKSILVEDYAHHPAAVKSTAEAGYHSLLAVPLMVGEKLIGIIGLLSRSKDVHFTSEHLEQMEIIGSMAAITIQNAQLYDEISKRAEESQVLIRIARTISASLDSETVLHEIATQANTLLQADGSRIHLADYESGTVRCVVALEPNAEQVSSFTFQIGEGLTGGVIESGEPMLINNPLSDPRSIQIPGTPEDEEECLAIVPLSIRKRTMGSMTVRRLGLDRPFTQTELDLLMAFAAQAAVAIENAHLFGQIESQAHQLEEEVIERTRELALSESKYRGLVETARSGIFQIDLEGRILFANEAMGLMVGISPEDVIGMHFGDVGLLTEEQVKENVVNFQARLRGDLPLGEAFEIELRSRTGRVIPALVGVSVFTDEDGRPQGMTGLVTDISERITLERALEAERDRLNALLTNIGDAVMVGDKNGIIQFVNPAWEQQTGYSAEEVIGRDPSFLRSEQYDELQMAHMRSVFDAGETYRGEMVICRKDGSEYTVETTITPVIEPTTGERDFISVLHDISALKEIDRLKSQFVSDVSHELRTPLTNIRLYLDLLERIRDEDKVTRYLVTLSRESERLSNLIDDLLSLSRLDVGTIPVVASPVNLNAILRSLAQDRESLAARKGLKISLELEEDLPMVSGDERLLGQVFTNLLTNAMNYTPEGGTITLRTHTGGFNDRPGVTAEVEDTGIGIPAEEQEQIFQRFFRGRASRSTGAPGTGLGLAICAEIIERHNGQISVVSDGELKQGSRFVIQIPTKE